MPGNTTHSKLPFLPSSHLLDMAIYKSMVEVTNENNHIANFKDQPDSCNTITLRTGIDSSLTIVRSKQESGLTQYIVFNKSALLDTEEDDNIYLGYDVTHQCPVGVRVHQYNEHRDNVIAKITPKTGYSNTSEQAQEQSHDKKKLTKEMQSYVNRIEEKTQMLRKKNSDSITRTFYPQRENIEEYLKIKDDSLLVTIMPINEGKPLIDFVGETTRLSPGHLLQIMLNSCKSLQKLHKQNILHPNISLDTLLHNPVTGEINIADLGSAHICIGVKLRLERFILISPGQSSASISGRCSVFSSEVFL